MVVLFVQEIGLSPISNSEGQVEIEGDDYYNIFNLTTDNAKEIKRIMEEIIRGEDE